MHQWSWSLFKYCLAFSIVYRHLGRCRHKAENTLEHVACWIFLCGLCVWRITPWQTARLASCAACPNPLAVGPSRWAKAEHATRLLLSHIYNRSRRGKCTTMFWQREANYGMQSPIQCTSAHCVLKCVPSSRVTKCGCHSLVTGNKTIISLSHLLVGCNWVPE